MNLWQEKNSQRFPETCFCLFVKSNNVFPSRVPLHSKSKNLIGVCGCYHKVKVWWHKYFSNFNNLICCVFLLFFAKMKTSTKNSLCTDDLFCNTIHPEQNPIYRPISQNNNDFFGVFFVFFVATKRSSGPWLSDKTYIDIYQLVPMSICWNGGSLVIGRYIYKERFPKNPADRRHWLSRHVQIIALIQQKKH